MLMRSSHRPGMRRGAKGFTLIELAVTFTLLGILIAVGLPSFSTWVNNSKIRTVAESIQSGVRRAQTEALRLNQGTVLSLTNDQPAVNSNAVANGSNWSIQTIVQFDRNVPVFVAGGTLANVGSGVVVTGPVALCFNANGRLVDNPASTGVPGASCAASAKQFDISHQPVASGDRPLRVLVAIGGQVRMCDPNRPTLSATSPDGCP